MYLSRIRIRNFRNFKDLDIGLTRNAVIVGENRVGKSNLIFAMRLVLDSSLADSGRQLKLTDICDGCDLADDPEVQVDLDFREFDSDKNLLALLTDHRTADDHNVARLSYVFRRRPDAPMPATSDADFDFKVFGGGDETVLKNLRDQINSGNTIPNLVGLLSLGGDDFLTSGEFAQDGDASVRHIVMSLLNESAGIQWLVENVNTLGAWVSASSDDSRKVLSGRMKERWPEMGDQDKSRLEVLASTWALPSPKAAD